KRRDTPESRADLERRLMEEIGVIADRSVRAEYHRFMRDRLFEMGRPKRPGSRAAARPRSIFVRDGPEPPPRSGRRVQRENLFRIILNFSWLIHEVAEEFAALDVPEPELDRLRREILQAATSRPGLDARALQ